MPLKIERSALHGRGCFATRGAAAGEPLASNPILTFTPDETELLLRTKLKNYLFYLRDGETADGPFHSALAVGAVSVCNHAAEANCDFALSEETEEIALTARRPIAGGEEITIDYGDYATEII